MVRCMHCCRAGGASAAEREDRDSMCPYFPAASACTADTFVLSRPPGEITDAPPLWRRPEAAPHEYRDVLQLYWEGAKHQGWARVLWLVRDYSHALSASTLRRLTVSRNNLSRISSAWTSTASMTRANSASPTSRLASEKSDSSFGLVRSRRAESASVDRLARQKTTPDDCPPTVRSMMQSAG